MLETIEQHSGAASFFAGISEKILVTPTETHTISGDDHALSIPQAKNLITAEQTKLSSCTIPEDIANHYFVTSLPQIVHTTTEPTSKEPECVPSVPAAGTVLLKADYNGQPLPEHYTMDHISLGPLDTTTPVLGRLNSCYGYRDHPVDGVYQFHGGLDIGAQTGDPILAFASGTVDYIGENSSYGLYLQLDHGNGIKSFYAHCSSVSVKKGQSVSLGEKIAEVGSTGTATGPHLHFELKYQGLHVDPAYYVDCISSQ